MTSHNGTGTDWTNLSVDEFRTIFRMWLSEELPLEWRNRSYGATDEGFVTIRRDFGQRLGSAGWLSVSWPASRGGGGLSTEHRIAVIDELVSAGAPEPMNANSLGIFAPTLIRFGTDAQCSRFLPPMLRHDALWCQGFSEPGAGSDLAAIATTAMAVDDGFRLRGQKVWTSYAHLADLCYMIVRTERSPVKHNGLSLVVLSLDQPGVTVRPLKNMAGTEEFCEVFLDDAHVPTENIVGEIGNGWSMAMYALGQERSVGLAQRSMRMTAEFNALFQLCEDERASGNPAMSEEFFAGALVDTFVQARAVDATVRRMLEIDGGGEDIGSFAPVAKLTWSESHQRQLQVALEVLGSRCVLDDQSTNGWWQAALFSRAETIYGGTSEIQRNLLGRTLGLPRSR